MSDLSFTRFVRHVGEVVKHPDLYLRELLLLVCILILIVFIGVVVFALLQTRPKKSQPKKERVIEDKIDEYGKAIKRRVVAIVVLLLVAVASLGIASRLGSSPSFCIGCHEMKQAFEHSEESTHRKVSCMVCHQEPGVLGMLIQKLEYVEMVAEEYNIAGNVSANSVTDEVCLRCHSSINDRTIISGAIRVEHVHSQKASYRCTDCHYEKGLFHADIEKLEKSKMSRCMSCHDGKEASTTCRTCHVRKASLTSHIDFSRYSRAEVKDSATCRTCHEVEKCLGCHEILLPHQEAWKAGGHAYNAFISKAICFECHVDEDCLKCHKKMDFHGNSWRKKHGKESKKPDNPCAQCHDYERFCMLCHGE